MRKKITRKKLKNYQPFLHRQMGLSPSPTSQSVLAPQASQISSLVNLRQLYKNVFCDYSEKIHLF